MFEVWFELSFKGTVNLKIMEECTAENIKRRGNTSRTQIVFNIIISTVVVLSLLHQGYNFNRIQARLNEDVKDNSKIKKQPTKRQVDERCSIHCPRGPQGQKGERGSRYDPAIPDTTAPELTNCPNNTQQANDPGLNSASVMWVPPQAIGNPGLPPIVTSNYNPGDVFLIGETTVRYVAKDGSQHESQPCTFIVTVTDEEKPTLVSCPADITERSSEININITWDDPVFVDNSGKDVNLMHLPQPGSEFYWGVKQEVRVEGRDEAGNLEVCSFFVRVIQFDCPFHPPPLNGALACESWLGGQFCSVSCQEGYDFSRTPEELYYCSISDAEPAWLLFPSFTRDPTMEFVMPWPDCSVMAPSIVDVDLSVEYYASSCFTEEGALEIKNDLIRLYQHLNIFFPGLCSDPETCKVENVVISCGVLNDA